MKNKTKETKSKTKRQEGTTVQVDEKTLKTLASLKQQLKAKSYHEVMEYLVNLRANTPSSLYGTTKGSKHYSHDRESEHSV